MRNRAYKWHTLPLSRTSIYLTKLIIVYVLFVFFIPGKPTDALKHGKMDGWTDERTNRQADRTEAKYIVLDGEIPWKINGPTRQYAYETLIAKLTIKSYRDHARYRNCPTFNERLIIHWTIVRASSPDNVHVYLLRIM